MTGRDSAESDAAFAEWCGHFSSDINGDCMTCAREAERRKGEALAWDLCAQEAHACGWLHEPALADMLERNPYRVTAPACTYYAGCAEPAKTCGYCATHCLCGTRVTPPGDGAL